MAVVFWPSAIKLGLDDHLVDRNLPLLVLFLTKFVKYNSEKSEERLHGINEFLQGIWAQFVWKHIVSPAPIMPTYGRRPVYQPRIVENPSASLTYLDILNFLETTNEYHPEFFNEAVKTLTSTLKDLKGHWECFANKVLPLIRLVASQNLLPLNLRTHPELEVCLGLFVKTALHMYIEEHVGRKPMPPQIGPYLSKSARDQHAHRVQ